MSAMMGKDKLKESFFVYVCLFCWIIIPLLFVEFYPFTLTPMYSANCDKASYFILKSEERHLPPASFGLHQKNCGSLDFYGRALPSTINHFGDFVPKGKAISTISNALKKIPSIRKIQVQQLNIGPNEKGNISIKERKNYTISNSFYNEEASDASFDFSAHLTRRVKNKDINPFYE